ncbi:alpha/beta fold hydrolase [Spirosoma utsteinense]|uniref:Pimeloyl-ACP methyl ester carboxylesterase n=1 Tax=Spirosoma utsteinense TaxID=2585773 RepID=A0ABR6WA59_9BACT|nr:alpha/beta hydrolase [Spirosoma utsteinense]MBC3784063.1 pimeloyl-ACP methyl ester carboxylesterase [Spirosoma utsteinense]MBC3793447.1 pimeloyl-ACP methyl ester carboxylesterase [Spirosoma utsteinense]
MSDSFTIVLIHGHGVDASIWDGIYAGLVSDGTVLRPDFSRIANLTTIEEYTKNLYDQLQAAGSRKVVLIGHSMGGYMALSFAERHPEMVHGLCLFHSTAYADDEKKKVQRQQIINALSLNGSRPFLETAITNMFAPDNREGMKATRQELIDRYSTLPSDALQSGIRAIMSRPDRTHVLQTAPFPVLIVAGRHDQLVSMEKSRQLADSLPKAQLTVLETSGHLGMIEQPDEALAILNSFVARL